MKLQSSSQTYTLSLDDLKQLLAEKIGVHAFNIKIESYDKCVLSDQMSIYPVVYAFAGLKVIVNGETE